MSLKQFMINRMVKKIRKSWGKSDAKRDEGLVTPEDVIRHDNLSYGPYGEWNLLDIYYTKGITVCQPTIVNVHGGAWVYGSKEVYQYYCMELARRGFTVVNCNYRLAPENRYPDALEDINQVLRFLKEQGEAYFVDTENLFMVGDSAGAQLASQYLTIYSNPEYAELFAFDVPEVSIRACALNCGLYDMKACALAGKNNVLAAYVGMEVMKRILVGKEVPESLHTVEYMTGDFPPAFVMTAYHDSMKVHAEPFYQYLKKLGVDCELKEYGSKEQKEIAHVFHVNCKLPEAKLCNDEECEFFRKYIVAGCEEENMEVNTLQQVTLEINQEDVLATELAYTITNHSQKDLNYGRDYFLQVEKSGNWYQVVPAQEVAITLELLWVPAGSVQKDKINWEYFYGELKPGHYRLIKPVSDGEKRHLLSGEFVIS